MHKFICSFSGSVVKGLVIMTVCVGYALTLMIGGMLARFVMGIFSEPGSSLPDLEQGKQCLKVELKMNALVATFV